MKNNNNTMENTNNNTGKTWDELSDQEKAEGIGGLIKIIVGIGLILWTLM
jgi:hypothetical protein